MPGAPNRPPTVAPPAPPPGEEAGRAVLRRLAPCRVALNLDLWKGAPAPDLLRPFERAEAAFAAGDWNGAQGALDQLAVRFAEPRWPTLPVPFRDLRVTIPPPQPPHWDPEHALAPAEKDANRRKREAERQIALAAACLAWMAAHGDPASDLAPALAEGRATFEREGAAPALWERLDDVWAAVRIRVPAPKGAGAPAPPPPPDAA